MVALKKTVVMKTKNNKTKNSYMEVMKKLSEKKGFEIKVDDLFYAGMEIVEVIRKSYNEEKIKEKWEKLIESVTNPNQDEAVYIRSHGRNGASSDSMLRLLENVFNRSFSIDKTNNSQPKKLLKEFCCGNYQDYQISHIFEERTNNPLLFTAPWMVCYTPKIIDPFTGHETKGFSEYKEKFIDWAFDKNREYIYKYNEIIISYWVKLKEYIDNSACQDYTEKFNKRMIVTLAPIVKEFEILSKSEKEKKYIELFQEKAKKS
jgi:hypothetical protein